MVDEMGKSERNALVIEVHSTLWTLRYGILGVRSGFRADF
jgi:hypothetical protein